MLFFIAFVLLSIVIVEALLQAARLIINAGKLSNRQYLLSPYEGKTWAKELFKEMLATGFRFDPLVGFGERPFAGTYVNNDEHGLRRTWSPEAALDTAAPTILVFGGSTIWGWGARDDFTVPSLMAKHLWDRGVACKAVNYGQKGYIFTQEIHQLTRALQEGVRPDHVVFCDGANDVIFSYRAGRADVPFEFVENRRRFEARDLRLAGVTLADWIRRSSAILRTATTLAARVGFSARTRYGTRAPFYTPEALQELAMEIAQARMRSVDFVAHLAEAYGFSYDFFWQPVIFYEDALTDEEVSIGPDEGDMPLGEVFRSVKMRLVAADLPHFHDLSEVFQGRRQTVYLDFAHVSEEGNRRLGVRMGDTLIQEGRFGEAVDRR